MEREVEPVRARREQKGSQRGLFPDAIGAGTPKADWFHRLALPVDLACIVARIGYVVFLVLKNRERTKKALDVDALKRARPRSIA